MAAARACRLDDAPPCPRSVPTRLTAKERQSIRDMVEADEYKHLSLRSLAILAQRMGRVFAAYGTWCRLTRTWGWRRPRRRMYPAKPRVGIRAQHPSAWLHIDTTVIKLLDGTKAYLHAVVDNYSRRVLSWALKPSLTAQTTREVLHEALQSIRPSPQRVRVMTDGGSENFVFAELGDVDQIVAQVDITESNSMVEALWHQLRHRWLYLHVLDTFAGLELLIAKYIADHNGLIPRAELGARTPDEAFFGHEVDLLGRLQGEHASARAKRIAENQERRCRSCQVSDWRSAA